ncbi:MAG: hypothetical protein QOH43_252 [Solirubrobacteraceae bacterium]|nr:hypothetical protein [Solirubrobacteraceae bacterium]
MSRPAARRPRVAAAATFPFFPPQGGGQLRVWHLYRQLARHADITVVCLTDYGKPAREREVAPGLFEWRVPMALAHDTEFWRLYRETGASMTDVSFPELHRLTPAYGEAVQRATAGADLLIACHPYTAPLLLDAAPGVPLWYEAQDMEWDLKGNTLPEHEIKQHYVDLTRATEATACDAAELVIACSDADAARFAEVYGVDDARLRVAPNGVEVAAVPVTTTQQRRATHDRLGMPVEQRGLFLASQHGPNNTAAFRLLDLARESPDLRFWIAGSVCDVLRDLEDVPDNAELFSILPDMHKDTLLAIADVMLNPVEEGSGTNLKTFEYLASGAPLVSTPKGLRGAEVPEGPAVVVADVDDFPAAMRQVAATDAGALDAHAAALRAAVARRYDWQAIVDRLLADPAVRERLSPKAVDAA